MQPTAPPAKRAQARIAYYGAPMAGKSTNLSSIFKTWPADARGELHRENVGAYCRMSLDLLVRSARRDQVARFTLETTPGCILYDHHRTGTLKTADGVVFVAHSGENLLEENIKHLRELLFMLKQYRRDAGLIPIVMQYNKRDLPNALDLATMQHYLNQQGCAAIEAVALKHVGVIETLRTICTLVTRRQVR